MKRPARTELPERVQVTKYYEHDGMLRAYANRAMVLAMLFAVIAMSSLGFAIYVRIQPPTVVRVDESGNATSVGSSSEQGRAKAPALAFAQTAVETAPTELESKAVVRRFLEDYLAHTPATVDQNLAHALNMMTVNLRTYSLGKLRDEDTVGKIKEDRIISQLQIRSIEPVKDVPLTYQAFGVKEIHRVRQRVESTDRIVGRYKLRLVQDRRSESNPSGLLVAEFSEQQMVGERDADLLQQSQLSGEKK
jgi:type IV secretory pathway TrbF-like protein